MVAESRARLEFMNLVESGGYLLSALSTCFHMTLFLIVTVMHERRSVEDSFPHVLTLSP